MSYQIVLCLRFFHPKNSLVRFVLHLGFIFSFGQHKSSVRFFFFRTHCHRTSSCHSTSFCLRTSSSFSFFIIISCFCYNIFYLSFFFLCLYNINDLSFLLLKNSSFIQAKIALNLSFFQVMVHLFLY